MKTKMIKFKIGRKYGSKMFWITILNRTENSLMIQSCTNKQVQVGVGVAVGFTEEWEYFEFKGYFFVANCPLKNTTRRVAGHLK